MMGIRTRKTRPAAVGMGLANKDSRKVAVTFDSEVFHEIRQLALTRNTSFAEQIRLLVERGLR